MTPEVSAAIEEIRALFPHNDVRVVEEPQGGAYVTVLDLPFGTQYVPDRGWVGFLITFQYPRADVYPHFLPSNITRADGRPHGAGFGGGTWNNAAAIQISRRSNRLDPTIDTAATKLAKVLVWINQQ